VPIGPDTIERALAHMMQGNSLASFARETGLNESTLRKACQDHPDYARARATQGDAHYERIVDVLGKVETGDIDPAAARVMIDGYKWTAGRMRPQVYGDKLDLSGSVEVKSFVARLPPVAASADEWAKNRK
jgi:lambda repressor-like predicted transcriptional regulator